MHNRKVGVNKKSSCGGFKVVKICVLLAIGIWLVQYHVNIRSQASTDELETDGSTVILRLGRRDLPYVQQAEEAKGLQLEVEGSYLNSTGKNESAVEVDNTSREGGGHHDDDDDHEERGAYQHAAHHTSLQFLQKESETNSNYIQQGARDQQHFSAFVASSKSDDTTVVEQESQVKSVEEISKGAAADHEPNSEGEKQIEAAYLHITTSNQTDHVTLSSSNTDEGSLSIAAESLNTYDESTNRSVAESGTEANTVETVEASSAGSRADNLQDSVVRQVSISDDETRILSPTFGGGGSFNNNDPSAVTEKTDMYSTDKLRSTFEGYGSFNNNDPSSVTESTDMSTHRLSPTFGGYWSFSNNDPSAITERTDMSTHRLSSSFGGFGSFNNNDPSAVTERTDKSTQRLSSTFGGYGSFSNNDSSAVIERTDMSTNRLSSTIGGYESPNNNDLSAITEKTGMSTDHNLNSTLAEPRPEEDDKIDDTAT